MNLAKAGAAALKILQRNVPFLLSAAAGIGLIGLYILTIKETEEAAEVLNEAAEEETQSFEMGKTLVKIYAPSFLCLLATLFCIVSSAVISHHRIRDLTVYAAGVTTAYNQYRQHNVFQNGKESDDRIISEVTRENIHNDPPKEYDGITCMLPGYDSFFTVSCIEDVTNAISELNVKMEKGPECCEMAEFFKLAKVREPMDQKYFAYGWDSYDLTRRYGVSMLYPHIFKDTDESGLEYYVIDLPMPRPMEMII